MTSIRQAVKARGEDIVRAPSNAHACTHATLEDKTVRLHGDPYAMTGLFLSNTRADARADATPFLLRPWSVTDKVKVRNANLLFDKNTLLNRGI